MCIIRMWSQFDVLLSNLAFGRWRLDRFWRLTSIHDHKLQTCVLAMLAISVTHSQITSTRKR